jgi:hypothetical protein
VFQVGAMLEEQPHHIGAAHVGRGVERRTAVYPPAGVRREAELQHEADRRELAGLGQVRQPRLIVA